MSAITLTKADLRHVETLCEWAKWVLSEYPELFTIDEEDTLLIVAQLVKEKLA